jgi:hypothetical protein
MMAKATHTPPNTQRVGNFQAAIKKGEKNAAVMEATET